jgi:chromosome partitioning protein
VLDSVLNWPASSTETGMKVIVVAAQKGGVGKTTLTRHLGVELTRRGYKTVLVDTDPQQSLTSWWNKRDSSEPQLMTADPRELENALPGLEEAGFETVVVDTPPQVNYLIKQTVELADLVLIPARPGIDDLEAVSHTVDLVADSHKPLIFVLNAAIQRSRLESQVAVALSQYGKLAPVVYQRLDYAKAVIDGRVAQELNPNGKAAGEMGALATYLLEQLGLNFMNLKRISL